MRTIETAPADVVAWTFLPAPSPLAFWARRQAHETAIHRVDAELAAGDSASYDGAIAADGIDEFVRGFAQRPGKYVSDPAKTLLLAPSDDPARWLLQVGPNGLRVVDDGEPDCTVAGPASDLYLFVWNRRGAAGLDISGDDSLAGVWRGTDGVTWR